MDNKKGNHKQKQPPIDDRCAPVSSDSAELQKHI